MNLRPLVALSFLLVACSGAADDNDASESSSDALVTVGPPHIVATTVTITGPGLAVSGPISSFNMSVTSPRDLATGQASGKRQHGAITIVKEWGAATPQLEAAAATHLPLTDVKIIESGRTFEFGGATIESVVAHPSGGATPSETITIVFGTVNVMYTGCTGCAKGPTT
jgi:hypothetical protein